MELICEKERNFKKYFNYNLKSGYIYKNLIRKL